MEVIANGNNIISLSYSDRKDALLHDTNIKFG